MPRMTKGQKRRASLQRTAEAARVEERAKFQRDAPRGPDAKGGGKGRGKGKRELVPHQLVALGCVSRTPADCIVCEPSEHICFAFNLPGGCPNAQVGGRCGRGLHVCGKCFLKHPASGSH